MENLSRQMFKEIKGWTKQATIPIKKMKNIEGNYWKRWKVEQGENCKRQKIGKDVTNMVQNLL